jgi:hypothetical protein
MIPGDVVRFTTEWQQIQSSQPVEWTLGLLVKRDHGIAEILSEHGEVVRVAVGQVQKAGKKDFTKNPTHT